MSTFKATKEMIEAFCESEFGNWKELPFSADNKDQIRKQVETHLNAALAVAHYVPLPSITWEELSNLHREGKAIEAAEKTGIRIGAMAERQICAYVAKQAAKEAIAAGLKMFVPDKVEKAILARGEQGE